MQNAAYVRLKTLSVGYTIPAELTERIAIQKARIFVSGENLFTITPMSKLIDPEALVGSGWGAGKMHFLRQVYALGLNVTF